jgi:hypothetical protein
VKLKRQIEPRMSAYIRGFLGFVSAIHAVNSDVSDSQRQSQGSTETFGIEAKFGIKNWNLLRLACDNRIEIA